MHILGIEIERSNPDYSFCGTLRFCDRNDRFGSLLWTMECEGQTRIDVAFVNGDLEDWSEVAQSHAHYLSDNIILAIARRQPLPVLSGSPVDLPMVS
ncbi:hypothetical protein COW36_18055 [bacterium (Candidatus Blackallbacteria) CG17_big_fil_post_rev_8_21_14_2_50_48_46]|uniref:Uncharacterized protein n=1 Tax=bacterium (Candidatus Blackallbacteria) CG17_big_fil_post_rev_8_21_14_2_50_48_46 TaxID=2014261 RepID=A0A2M7G0W3_9BACT|nr:MAG: hypothetical protein COW64_00670 [bacterium (Candidatus Blackallbacteria) CG18_big_fil_WC_8_21_14_2_50_49_26]PIW15319.1 MAG: hypothetical protein COW36_18055 [bacterium (Candidatus Blackallbacteria) CG17_big_fil_post_rev_8_21_14_2_50_48_46]PIW45170.1 MAG: hypothetical protein COW20_20960 [bacterium (Candidatus Blackallbacteria) CG13_big_fil_rev_8_21_14_2_50_49_14]